MYGIGRSDSEDPCLDPHYLKMQATNKKMHGDLYPPQLPVRYLLVRVGQKVKALKIVAFFGKESYSVLHLKEK